MKSERRIRQRLQDVDGLLKDFEEAKKTTTLNPRLQQIESNLKTRKRLLEWILK